MSKYQNESFSDVATKVMNRLAKQEQLYQKSVRPKMQRLIFMLTAASFSVMNFAGHGLSVFKPIFEIIEPSDFELLHRPRVSPAFVSVLALYSVCLMVSGQISDKFSIQKLLTFCLLVMCVCNFMIGIGDVFEISNPFFATFFVVISSLCSSLGWPSYMSLIGNWFARPKRGFVLGAWASCCSLGYLISFVFMSFIAKSLDFQIVNLSLTFWLFLGVLAVLNSHYLIENPAEMNIVVEVQRGNSGNLYMTKNDKINCENINNQSQDQDEDWISRSLLDESLVYNYKDDNNQAYKKSIPLYKAFRIRRVILYSVWACLIKFSTFAFTGWILENKNQELNSLLLSNQSIFIAIESGVVLGSIVIGVISDKLYCKRTLTLFICLMICGVICCLYPVLNSSSPALFYTVWFIIGFLSGSTFNLIGSVVAIDIAKDYYETVYHRAISTISGIIYGFGSLGATIGLLIVLLTDKIKFKHCFLFLGWSLILSSLIIFKYFIEDVKDIKRQNLNTQTNSDKEVELKAKPF